MSKYLKDAMNKASKNGKVKISYVGNRYEIGHSFEVLGTGAVGSMYDILNTAHGLDLQILTVKPVSTVE